MENVQEIDQGLVLMSDPPSELLQKTVKILRKINNRTNRLPPLSHSYATTLYAERKIEYNILKLDKFTP